MSTALAPRISASTTVVAELNRVVAEVLDLEPISRERPKAPECPDLWFFSAISFPEFASLVAACSRLIPRGAHVIGYVFDGFTSDRLRRLPAAARPLTPYVRHLRRFDTVFHPIRAQVDEQNALLGTRMSYLPIGVDSVRFGAAGAIDARWVTVNGYGRQPMPLSRLLSDRMNTGPGEFFHHTNHAGVGTVVDADRHRAHFWSLLRRSRIALAYAPEVCDPSGRFPCSFVGQRWFEALAAGCLVAGVRPSAPEADALLDWPDATVELPDEPEDAYDVLVALAADRDRLTATSHTNHYQSLARHDWRYRVAEMVEPLPDLAALADRHVADLGVAAARFFRQAGDVRSQEVT